MFPSSLTVAGGNAGFCSLRHSKAGRGQKACFFSKDSCSTDLLAWKESNQRSMKWNCMKQVKRDGDGLSSNCCILIEQLSIDIPLEHWHGAWGLNG